MFHKLFKKVMAFEGGYSDHPSDHGGRTKWGLTKGQAESNGVDFDTLTITDVEKIFFAEYYQCNRIGHLMGSSIHDFMFDWCVHSGPRVIKIMQEVLGVETDGVIGPITGKAAKKHNFLRDMQRARLKDQVRICDRSVKQEDFLVGWARRAVDPIWGRG